LRKKKKKGKIGEKNAAFDVAALVLDKSIVTTARIKGKGEVSG
jgi:hypothetical protein